MEYVGFPHPKVTGDIILTIIKNDETNSKHSWFPPMVRGTDEALTSLDVWIIIGSKEYF